MIILFVSLGKEAGMKLDFVLEEKSFKNISAIFTKPSAEAMLQFTFYVHNIGKFDAYLKSVDFTMLDNGEYKKCSSTIVNGEPQATDALVQAA